jgi:FixJ family two-component response regulator
MSGYADPDMGNPARRNHKRYSFLQKPFTASVLLDAVRRELDIRQRHSEPRQ